MLYGHQIWQSVNQLGKVANPARGCSSTGEMNISLSPFSPNNLALRDRLGLTRNPDWGLREASRGSAVLTGVTRDRDAMNGSVQEKAVLDDPVPEMAACRTDILLL